MKVIVMTGATSGIGAEAMKHLTTQPDTLIIIGARGSGRIVPKGTEVIPLDLSSLKSVHSFSDGVKQRLGDTPIDILILNAGANFLTNKEKTIDGFESTFATNHLSHYLLSRLLWPNMTKNGTIIFTTSDTHDPDIIPLGPKKMIPKELANPTKTSGMQGMRAYPASKLCNLLTAKYFAELPLLQKGEIITIAYNPGATTGTSLGASKSFASKIMPLIIKPIMSIVSIFNPAFHLGSVERAGEALAELALHKVSLPKGRIYASLVKGKITFPNPSKLAQTNEAKESLWKASAVMVGLPNEM
jgi:NAD(P)-dependent dehydrogenase (short-subunit alcohol dehydrogenase family)